MSPDGLPDGRCRWPLPDGLLMLNGCHARILELALSNQQPSVRLGKDTWLYPAAIEQTALMMAARQRADVVIDFTDSPGEMFLQNLLTGWMEANRRARWINLSNWMCRCHFRCSSSKDNHSPTMPQCRLELHSARIGRSIRQRLSQPRCSSFSGEMVHGKSISNSSIQMSLQ